MRVIYGVIASRLMTCAQEVMLLPCTAFSFHLLRDLQVLPQ